jgi:hypothetical protein
VCPIVQATTLFQLSPLALLGPYTLPNADPGVFYSYQLPYSGGAAPYTFTSIGTPLPTGFTLNPSTGLISGTTVTAQTVLLTIQLTDQNNDIPAIANYLLTVSSLLFVGETLPSASVGVLYTQNISGQASGGNPPYMFSMVTYSSPGGNVWTVSPAGVISGTPVSAATGFVFGVSPFGTTGF